MSRRRDPAFVSEHGLKPETWHLHSTRKELAPSIPATFCFHISHVMPTFQNLRSSAFNYTHDLKHLPFGYTSSNLTTRSRKSSDPRMLHLLRTCIIKSPSFTCKAKGIFPFLFPAIPHTLFIPQAHYPCSKHHLNLSNLYNIFRFPPLPITDAAVTQLPNLLPEGLDFVQKSTLR